MIPLVRGGGSGGGTPPPFLRWCTAIPLSPPHPLCGTGDRACNWGGEEVSIEPPPPPPPAKKKGGLN